MPYLDAADLPVAPAGDRLRAVLARPGILTMPGAYNGLAAAQARGITSWQISLTHGAHSAAAVALACSTDPR